MQTVIQNSSTTFDIRPYLVSRGWSIVSPSIMQHTSENSGEILVNSYPIQEGREYEYSFEIANRTSGGVVVSLGGVSSTPKVTNGYHQGTVTALNSDKIEIWSDGDLQVKNFNVLEKVTEDEDFDGKTDTVTWSEQRSGWVTFKDFIPDCGFSMYTNMFTLKDGNLWVHKVDGTTTNEFYGTQYTSKVKFPVASVGVKTYHSIAVHSDKVLGTTPDGITTQIGQVSDLITYDFTSKEGIHYANLLRDKLLNEKLKGRYIVIELTDEETKGVSFQLFKIVVKSNPSTFNE